MAKNKCEDLASAFDTLSSDLEVPNASDVVFRHTWCIKKYNRAIKRKETLDSPMFDCSVNGLSSSWNISVRFWKSKITHMYIPIHFASMNHLILSMKENYCLLNLQRTFTINRCKWKTCQKSHCHMFKYG